MTPIGKRAEGPDARGAGERRSHQHRDASGRRGRRSGRRGWCGGGAGGALAGLVLLATLLVAPVGSARSPAAEFGDEGARECRGPGPSDRLPEAGHLTRRAAERAGIDVTRYDLALDLRRAEDGLLRGRARLHLRVGDGPRDGTARESGARGRAEGVPLDLVGLRVDSARLDGQPASCRHDGAVVRIRPRTGDGRGAGEGDGSGISPGEHTVEIFYRGRPRDGLVFGEDATGAATVFADNWPNRARWWFPSNDHPSDKATVRFAVRAPEGREVVANGRLVRRGDADGPPGEESWVWETEVPIPVYTMVIGVADFGVARLGEAACELAPRSGDGCADVDVWALPGDSAYGVTRFRRAPRMLDFYAELFGPFPYEKLAHVESGTRFGGMENASAIFYARAPWSEREMGEGVIAHETVHQWFGDSVTPAEWAHLWVSEGFATYFDYVFFGEVDGPEALRERLATDRREILASEASDRPVVDTAAVDLYSLLNTNSYQKGAWVLHMLRGTVGDSAFFEGIRRYYERGREGTATTADVRRVMEEVSGRELGWFFRQWLHEPGHPVLDLDWRQEDDDLVVVVRQRQPDRWPVFRLHPELEVETSDGSFRRPVTLSSRADTFRLDLSARAPGRAAGKADGAIPGAFVERVRIDPERELLWEAADAG